MDVDNASPVTACQRSANRRLSLIPAAVPALFNCRCRHNGLSQRESRLQPTSVSPELHRNASPPGRRQPCLINKKIKKINRKRYCRLSARHKSCCLFSGRLVFLKLFSPADWERRTAHDFVCCPDTPCQWLQRLVFQVCCVRIVERLVNAPAGCYGAVDFFFFFYLSPLQFVQPVVGMSEMKCQRKQFLELRKK